jgi:hypothetical protein
MEDMTDTGSKFFIINYLETIWRISLFLEMNFY